jgi:hypothetical protein
VSRSGTRATRRAADPAALKWNGATRRYDLVKEFVIALVVVTMMTVTLAAVFSSPDDAPVTLASWTRSDPKDFVTTAVSELNGSSGTGGYGPPYNAAAEGQKIGPLALAKIAGVHLAINPAEDFVLQPLDIVAADSADLKAAVATWRAASSTDQMQWTDNYLTAVDQATFDGATPVPPGNYGPVGAMMTALLATARSGALDGELVTAHGFYNNDYTKPLLFLGDGSYLSDLATTRHLQGNQWGIMNEVGNYPGQPWLWLYTFWYQVPPFKTSGNADALIWGIMAMLTLTMVLVPFIPGLRSVPQRTRIYRLIWRDHYRSQPIRPDGTTDETRFHDGVLVDPTADRTGGSSTAESVLHPDTSVDDA